MCTVHKAVTFRLTGKEVGMSCQHGIGLPYYMAYSSMLGSTAKAHPVFGGRACFYSPSIYTIYADTLNTPFS